MKRRWLGRAWGDEQKGAEQELEEEIAAHLAIEEQQRINSGESPEGARLAAARIFGNVSLVKDVTRSMWGQNYLEQVCREFKHAARMLIKTPGFAAAAVLTLALGIGANTALFSVDYAALLAPLPYPHAGQLVIVWSRFKGQRQAISAADFLDWKRENTVFQDLNAWTSGSFNMATAEEPWNVEARIVTPGLDQMLGTPFVLGRGFTREEGQPGASHVVVHGVIAFTTEQRAHEFALRMALGATRPAVIGLVMKEGAMLAGIGMSLGLIGAYLVDGTMRNTLFGVGNTDFAALGVVMSILMLAACAACYVPARRSVSIDPSRVLKVD